MIASSANLFALNANQCGSRSTRMSALKGDKMALSKYLVMMGVGASGRKSGISLG